MLQPACCGLAPRPPALRVPSGARRLFKMSSGPVAAASADFQVRRCNRDPDASHRRCRGHHSTHLPSFPVLLQGCTEALPSPIKIVGMGSSGQDLLAQVCCWGAQYCGSHPAAACAAELGDPT